jgi:hypothetical protein
MGNTVSRMVSAGMFTASLAGAATLGYVTGASAQVTFPKLPEVLKGEDIGFRPAQEGSRVGTLMIRVEGKWVEAQLSSGPRMMPAK